MLTDDDLVQMARAVGATAYTNRHYPDSPTHTFTIARLRHFAALIAEREREACAEVCEDLEGVSHGTNDPPPYRYYTAIRARGNHANPV